MDILLMIAVTVTALAIIVQAGVLVYMYLLSQRVVKNVDSLIEEARALMTPMELVMDNLKNTSAELLEVGKSARNQMHRVAGLAEDARGVVQAELDEIKGMGSDVRSTVNETVEEVRDRFMAPMRKAFALSSAVSEGIRVFFRGRKSRVSCTEEEELREFPRAM
jgi:hypothetical protein